MTFIKGGSQAGTSISLRMGREGPFEQEAGRLYTLAVTKGSLPVCWFSEARGDESGANVTHACASEFWD